MNDKEKNTVSEGEEREVQLCPFGEWPQRTEDGERVVQVCDGEAFRQKPASGQECSFFFLIPMRRPVRFSSTMAYGPGQSPRFASRRVR